MKYIIVLLSALGYCGTPTDEPAPPPAYAPAERSVPPSWESHPLSGVVSEGDVSIRLRRALEHPFGES